MAKAVISSILQSQLGKYVDGLSPDSLQVGLWSGELLLTNLKLKPNALAELKLPIQIVQGSIGKIHVVVPWNQLGSASVQITIEGIYGVAVPNKELPTQEEVLMGIRNSLERAELIRQHQRHSNKQEESKEDDSFFTRLTSRILDNLLITIRDFHIRYEDTLSNPASPFTCGVLMESFCIETTDENGAKVFIDRSTSTPKKMHKVAKLRNLAVYWDILTPDTQLEKSKSFENKMREIIYSDFRQTDRRWLLLPPCSLAVHFTKNETHVFTMDSPKYYIRANLKNLAFQLTRQQYNEMVFMYKALAGRMAVEAHFWYNRHRPYLSILNYPIVWWDYAVRFHSKKKKLRFRWSVVPKMARDRKMYVALYKQLHLQKKSLETEQVEYLQRLEDTFPMELIMRLREISEDQFEASKAQNQPSSSWYGYFFGEETKSDVLSVEGRADLQRAFEETVALETAPIPENCNILVVDVVLEKGETGLFTYQNTPLLTCDFQGSLSFYLRPNNRWNFQLELKKLNILNWRTKSTKNEIFCKLKNDEKINPFHLSIGFLEESKLKFRLTCEPLHFIIDPIYILKISEFFSTNDTQWDQVWAYATSSVQSYVFAEQEADMLAAVAKNIDTIYDILIDIKAPVVILPENANLPSSKQLVLDFGRFYLQDTKSQIDNVYSWQMKMTHIEVHLEKEFGGRVSIIPPFNINFNLNTLKKMDGKMPVLSACAKLELLIVFLSKDIILQLREIENSIGNQCKNYLKSSPLIENMDDSMNLNDIEIITKVDTCGFSFKWDIESIQVNFSELFSLNLIDTSLKYEIWTSYSLLNANLKDLTMEDHYYSLNSPYHYLAKTNQLKDLIELNILTSCSPQRQANILIDIIFNELDIQWNPSSIMVLYEMISVYESNENDENILIQNEIYKNNKIPKIKLKATLKKLSITLNKNHLNRCLLNVSINNACLIYILNNSINYNINGSFGDILGIDYSILNKNNFFKPFFGMENELNKNLIEFSYENKNKMPILSIQIYSIRIVYIHQQILELMDYLFQGILGILVNQTLMSATQMLLEPATLVLNIRIDAPKIIIPTDPTCSDHLLVTSRSLELFHYPDKYVEYNGNGFEYKKDGDINGDLKRVVLENAEFFCSNENGYDILVQNPLHLPRFSIDCHMPDMNLNISRKNYLMFFNMLNNNIGGKLLIDEENLNLNNLNHERPIVIYEYANNEMESATISLTFLMESFSCIFGNDIILKSNNLIVSLNILNELNPYLDISLATISIKDLLYSNSIIKIKYEWNNDKSNLNILIQDLYGNMIPHLIINLIEFFKFEENKNLIEIENEINKSILILLSAKNVQLKCPCNSLNNKNDINFVLGSNFEIEYETYPSSQDNLRQRLNLIANNCEAFLSNANRQGCCDTFVQLIEPTNFNLIYQGFILLQGNGQDKIDILIDPIEVYLSYEDIKILIQIIKFIQKDIKPIQNETELIETNILLNKLNEIQRHVTCDIKKMQLTLINDCNGCDMGLLQLELPTCRIFLNATSTNYVTTATGGGDISFAASYYNPDHRIWHPLCHEWKLNATVMTNISHKLNENEMNSIQWTISADTLDCNITHGLLEALVSAGSTLINKSNDIKNAPCVIKNNTGLNIQFWWSNQPNNIIDVKNKKSADIHYQHIHGNGSGVTRRYTSNDRNNNGTLSIHLIDFNMKPVQGIVVDELGIRPFTLIEENGSKSRFSVTCNTELIDGHIVLTISSHIRVQSHLSNDIELLVYDPTWKTPIELGELKPFELISIPIPYSTGSELRVKFKGIDWAFSSPIPMDGSSISTITVTSSNSIQHAVFNVSIEKGFIELYEPYVLENKLPVSVMYQVKDAQSLPKGDDIIVGCKSGIWWCRHNPLFAFNIPGCETTNWLALLKKRDTNTFSLNLNRLDKKPFKIIILLNEKNGKSITITLLADIWIINRTGLNFIYGNENDDIYIPIDHSIVNKTEILFYSNALLLRFKMETSTWTNKFQPDPRRMNWHDEILSFKNNNNGQLYEFGVSADYATRHFGLFTRLVSITPRYVIINHTPWTLILLEDDGCLHGMEDVHHVINSNESYSLYWINGKRTSLRASIVDISGTCSWSELFSIDIPTTFDIIIPNDIECPYLQISIKNGGQNQATFVIDIIQMENEPDYEESKWDIISYDIKMSGFNITLTDSLNENTSYLYGQDVARFTLLNLSFDSFKDRTSTNSNLKIDEIKLVDLLNDTIYPNVLKPLNQGNFLQFKYISKRHRKYAYIDELILKIKDIQLETSMKFIDRILLLYNDISSHLKKNEMDLLTYFTTFDTMESMTGRKCYFKKCHIHPIHIIISFLREKDDRIDPSAGFWLSNLKFCIKNASLNFDSYKLNDAFATKESVLESIGQFYLINIKNQALNLIESIQVTSLVSGVVKDSVTSLVSTLIGKTDLNLQFSSYKFESLSNQMILKKHSNLLNQCNSVSDFPNLINHLIFDWDGNHTGLEARGCLAVGILNNSRQSIVMQMFLKDGAEIYTIPLNRSHLEPANNEWNSKRSLILFAWGYTPTLLTSGDICIQLQSNGFNLYLSKNSTRIQPNPGYTATCTMEEKKNWWSKYIIIIGDDIHAKELNDNNDTYEVLFHSDALGIVAKQQDYQTVVVRECCYFSNGQPGPALACGKIHEGDIILSVNGIPIKSIHSFKETIINSSRPIIVRFRKEGYDLFGEKNKKINQEYNLFG